MLVKGLFRQKITRKMVIKKDQSMTIYAVHQKMLMSKKMITLKKIRSQNIVKQPQIHMLVKGLFHQESTRKMFCKKDQNMTLHTVYLKMMKYQISNKTITWANTLT